MAEIAEVLRNHLPERAAKMPRRQLPDWLVRLAALFDPVTGGVTFELGVRRDCDSSRARELLGFAPRSNREAIIATADSLLAQQLV